VLKIQSGILYLDTCKSIKQHASCTIAPKVFLHFPLFRKSNAIAVTLNATIVLFFGFGMPRKKCILYIVRVAEIETVEIGWPGVDVMIPIFAIFGEKNLRFYQKPML
jgi:hypothetical protein